MSLAIIVAHATISAHFSRRLVNILTEMSLLIIETFSSRLSLARMILSKNEILLSEQKKDGHHEVKNAVNLNIWAAEASLLSEVGFR